MLSADLILKLLGAIEADSLVFLCGAGLSIPLPSDLPSALTVSRACFDRWVPSEPTLDRSFRDRVDLLSEHFRARGDFLVFVTLVPWDKFVGAPNRGHAAVADLLVSRAAHAALSANYDAMIETWAEQRKVALRGALDGQEATRFTTVTSPLIKFHGCLHRARERTIWTQGQLNDPETRQQIDSCAQWMNLHLPQKHIVVVGFWSDWGYLNDVLANALAIDSALSVTLIDPQPRVDLETKAPTLWGKLNALSKTFEHVQASGDIALEELRTAFSKAWSRKYYALGTTLVTATGGMAPFEALSVEELYDLRRDAQGVSYARAATQEGPHADAAQAASFHVMLHNAGAVQTGPWLDYKGRSIRVVNGAGRGLEQVRGEYNEPPSVTQADLVICAGSTNVGVPAHLIAPGLGLSLMHPGPGGTSKWLTIDDGRVELGI